MPHDRIDLHILDLIQHDATLPLARIADRVGLSQTPCWKRIKRLEQTGVIRRRVGLLDPDALDLSVTAFLLVEAPDQSRDWRDAFCAAVAEMPAAVETHRLSGRHDFMVKVMVPDTRALDALVETLTARVTIRACDILLAAERIATTTALPLQARDRNRVPV